MIKNDEIICGIDEAGRGCLAGSLFVCGVLCKKSELITINEIKDSKKLSQKKRKLIYIKAKEVGIRHFVVKIEPKEIDELGISKTMASALNKIKLSLPCLTYIFDGNTDFGISEINTLIKGDSLIPQISLASIIAKVYKDRECENLHTLYPLYNFHKNKGYGTNEHRELIKKYGLSDVHRKSFKIKN